MSDTMREAFDVWVNVYPPLPEKYNNSFGNTLTAHETREDALNNAGHSCLATCLLRFDGEQLKAVEQKKDYSELVYLLRNAVRTFDTAEMLDAAANAIEELSKKDKPC